MPQKFFAAPVERPRTFSLRAHFSLAQWFTLPLVFASRSLVASYSPFVSRAQPVTLTVCFCQLRSLRSLFLPSCSSFYSSSSLRDTQFFVSDAFLSSVQFAYFYLLDLYIYFSNTYVYTAEFFSVLRSFTLLFYTVLLVSSARVLCTLVTSAFFFSRNVSRSNAV